MSLKIRPLRVCDEVAWRPLWQGYLDYYHTELSDDITTNTFERMVGDERYFALGAELDNELVGFAHCLIHPSIWAIKDYCYLEDLFVAESARGSCAARELIEALYAEADNRGCARVYWFTEDGNARARKLYDKLATVTDFVQYRR